MSEWHTDRQIGLTASEIFSALIYSLKTDLRLRTIQVHIHINYIFPALSCVTYWYREQLFLDIPLIYTRRYSVIPPDCDYFWMTMWRSFITKLLALCNAFSVIKVIYLITVINPRYAEEEEIRQWDDNTEPANERKQRCHLRPTFNIEI